jgi:hypothetical protein
MASQQKPDALKRTRLTPDLAAPKRLRKEAVAAVVNRKPQCLQPPHRHR